MNLDFPYRFDGRARTAETDYEDHIRDLIEQLLFTSPGERVNRPDFGCGFKQLVFAPNSDELAATLQFLGESAIQQWLGHLIKLEALEVENQDATLQVRIKYTILKTQELKTATFSH